MVFNCPGGLQWTYIQQYITVDPKPTQRAVSRVWLRADKPVSGVGFHLYVTPIGLKEGGFNSRSRVDVTTEWKQYKIAIEFALIRKSSKGYNMRPLVQLHTSGVQLQVDDAQLLIEQSKSSAALIKAIKRSTEYSLGADVISVNAPIGVTGGIIPRPDRSLVVIGPNFTIRRSTDGGRTWSKSKPLAINDQDNHITGAIALNDGAIGIWTESWNRPMYFWRSEDEGKTWTNRFTMGPKGAPLHGNVMIETKAIANDKVLAGWNHQWMNTDEVHNAPDSQSSLQIVAGGYHSSKAAALQLDPNDKWVYAQQRVTPDRPLKSGDQFIYRAALHADKPVSYSMYIEAWNGKTNKGSRAREYFQATAQWSTHEVKLDVGPGADGLTSFRVIVQLAASDVQLQFDNISVKRVKPDELSMSIVNAGFEQRPSGRLLIACREGHSVHGGLWKGAASYGTTHDGQRIPTESHGHAAEMDITFVYYSDDGGRSWKRSEGDVVIWKDDGYGGIWPVDEPNIAELKDGRL